MLVVLSGQSLADRNRVALALLTQTFEAGLFRQVGLDDALQREVALAFGLSVEELTRDHEQKRDRLALRNCDDQPFVRSVMYSLFQLHDLSADEMRELPDLPQSPQTIMEWWRTTYRGRQNPEYWRQQLRVFIQQQPQQNFVVSDADEPAAFGMLKELGGKIVALHHPGDPSIGASVHDYVLETSDDNETLHFMVSGLVDVISLVQSNMSAHEQVSAAL